jgi:ankyrin repeat protein
MEQGYLAQVQALIDLKWKENPEEMKRVMAEIEAKEKAEKKKAKVKPPKRVSFDPQLTQELIEELNKDWDVVDMSKVQDLIDRGADVEAEDEYGRTPLHWASLNNYVAIAKLLIEAGADVKAKNVYGHTSLHYASANNHIETAKLLIERGADLEAKTNDGWTPLYWASARNFIEIVELLIERGADVNAKEEYGNTPLHLAHSDGMKTLLKKYMK